MNGPHPGESAALNNNNNTSVPPMRDATLLSRPAYGNCICPIKPDRVIPYIDVVAVCLDHAPSAPDLAAFDRRRYRVWRPRPQHRFRYTLIFFFQPTPDTLDAIDRHGWPLCYVELALDWLIANHAARTEAATFFRRHFVHPRSGDLRIVGHSSYTRARKSRTNVVMYADRPSKLDDRSRCVHVEYRIRGRAKLRAAHIHSAADLIAFDHRRLWRELLRFYDLDVERFGRHVMNRHNGTRRRTAHDIDRREAARYLYRSGSIQQLIADLRRTKFAVQRQHLILIETPERLLPAERLLSGYLHTSESVPLTTLSAHEITRIRQMHVRGADQVPQHAAPARPHRARSNNRPVSR
jgi:hypothetical protein